MLLRDIVFVPESRYWIICNWLRCCLVVGATPACLFQEFLLSPVSLGLLLILPKSCIDRVLVQVVEALLQLKGIKVGVSIPAKINCSNKKKSQKVPKTSHKKEIEELSGNFN